MNKFINIFKQNTRKPETAESFESITLRISGMRFSIEYEVLMKDDLAEVTKYGIRFENGEDKRIVELKNTCEKERILKLINDCDLLSWNGFVGNHPKNVSDGIMFTMKATINGKEIYAHGSENFPEHYREFIDGLTEIIREAENE